MTAQRPDHASSPQWLDSDSFRIVAMAENATDATAFAEQHRPDVALLDVEMPGGGARAAVPAIAACSPATRVVICRPTRPIMPSSSCCAPEPSPTCARAWAAIASRTCGMLAGRAQIRVTVAHAINGASAPADEWAPGATDARANTQT